MKRKILFGTIGWNIAETTRMIEIAKGFQSDYDCHFFSYGGKFLSLVEDAGFTLHQLEPIEDDQKIELLWKIDRGEAFKQPWSVEELRMRISNELRLLEELKPEICFLGSVLTFSISCKIAKTRLYNFIPLSLSSAYLEAGLPISPFLPRWLNKMATWIFLHVPLLMGNVRKVMKEYGLPPAKHIIELWQGDVNIVADVKEFSLLEKLPNDWYFSGPLFAHLPSPIPLDVQTALKTKKKKVYFAMGSSANYEVLVQSIQAFKELDVVVISPIKSHLKGSESIPPNVIITDWLPALEVTSQVDLAVIHGGQGTVQTTVMAGVPFVGIGMQPEQEINIYVYKKFGNAIQLPKKTKPIAIVNAVKAILSDDTYSQQARKAKTILESVDTVSIVRSIVEEDVKRTL